MSLEMYQQNILDHSKHPHNFGTIKGAKATAHVANPLCGDELDFFLAFDADGKVAEVKFTGRGCAISMASASMLTEKLQSMNREAIGKVSSAEVLTMLNVKINPARLKCATLSLEAAQKAIGHH